MRALDKTMFGSFYKKIFDDLNAPQMIIAVTILRYCDAVRKRDVADPNIKAMRSYSNYFIACMVGTKLLRDMKLSVEGITHKSLKKS